MRPRLFLILLVLIIPLTGAIAGESKEITFAVGCYDVSASALESHPGVLQVDKGWQRYDTYKFREINRVEYDPKLVNVEQLEQWLKQADTWHATLQEQNKE